MKIGDKVRRIRGDEYENSFWEEKCGLDNPYDTVLTISRINVLYSHLQIEEFKEGNHFYKDHIWNLKLFELVNEDLNPDPIEQLKYAESLIGKNVNLKGNNNSVTIKSTKIVVSGGCYSQSDINNSIKEHGFCVVISCEKAWYYPLSHVIEIKKERVKVSLNPKYDAYVSDKEITVGCQTFPIEILEQLQKALKEYNAQ